MKVWVAVLLLSSCSLVMRNDGPKSAKGKEYSIHFAKPGWAYKIDDRSDYVFENKDGRILLSNSFCEEFQDQPLEQLAHKTFKTVKNFKPLSEAYTTFQNREAYKLEGKGNVDGVEVRLALLNTRRSNCYFDFVLIDPEPAKHDTGPLTSLLDTVVFK